MADIPKVVHQYWDEGSSRWDVNSWDIPGWEHYVWTKQVVPDWFVPTPQWEDPAAYHFNFNNPVERMRANVLRFELLGEVGGVWADFDMELVGDVDELLVGSCNVAMFGSQVGTGFIAAEPHHPFVESCRKTLREMTQPVGVSSMWAASFAPLDDVTFLDPMLVYPNDYWSTGEQREARVLVNHPRVK